MYTWVYKHETPARRELDPKSKQIECIRGYLSAKTYKKGVKPKKSKENVYVGIQAQNTCKKGVKPKKQKNRMYTCVYTRKTRTRRELDPICKKIECLRGYTSAKHLQEGS